MTTTLPYLTLTLQAPANAIAVDIGSARIAGTWKGKGTPLSFASQRVREIHLRDGEWVCTPTRCGMSSGRFVYVIRAWLVRAA